MLEHLFGSKTRLKLLKTFFRDPAKSYFVRELTRLTETQINAVRRELVILIKADLVKEVEVVAEPGDAASKLKKYYALNAESILYPELNALLIKAQVLGEQKFIDEVKIKSGELKLFLLTGSFTGDKNAPSDMLLVGNVKEKSVTNLIKKYEMEFGFEIRYTIMTEQEFYDRRHVMDKFLYALFEGESMKVLDLLKS